MSRKIKAKARVKDQWCATNDIDYHPYIGGNFVKCSCCGLIFLGILETI